MKTKTMIRRYCRQVKHLLPCPGRQKKAILAEIKANLTDFLSENPEADFSALKARFGMPRSVAAAYVEDLDTEGVLRSLWSRRRIVTIVASVLIVALLLWTFSIIWVTGVYVEHSHVTITEITYEIPMK